MLLFKKTGIALCFYGMAALSFADSNSTPQTFTGYSYAAFGYQSLHYTESPSLIHFRTTANTSNITFVSGGLFEVNDLYDFSLDTESSLFNTPADEHWTNTSTLNIPGTNQSIGPDTVVQTDRLQMDVGMVRAMLHYKVSNAFRLLGGLTYMSLDSKRFLPTTPFPSLIKTSGSLVDERDDTISPSVGFAWESGALAQQRQRWRIRTVLDLPLFRQVTNSQIASPISSGFDWGLDLSGAYDLRVYKGLEVGVLSDYFYRRGTSVTFGTSGGTAEYPQHTLSQFFVGFEIGWNLQHNHDH